MHQDHGNSPATCRSAIENGFTSVMMDGSLKDDGKTPGDYAYNVQVTREVVEMAHRRGVSVEGELGVLGSLETGQGEKEDGHGAEGVLSHDQLLTDPDEAERFVADTGVDAEIIDLRTLLPLDVGAIEASVRKTGRCVIIHEATLTSGFGAELSALVQETCFYHLQAPVTRVAGWDTPYPHAQEWDYFPGPARVGRALLAAMEQ